MKLIKTHILLLGAVLFTLEACMKDPEEKIPLSTASDEAYEFNLPPGFPPMDIPDYNPTTKAGVALGKKLFFDPLLSGNNTQSCAGCHQQNAAFADSGIKFSRGSTGVLLQRNSMPLFNLGYAKLFFWDGKSKTLEEQVFHPVVSQNEMNQDPQKLSLELSAIPEYRSMFGSAFGSEEVNFDRISRALAQFMRTMISHSPKSVDTGLLSAQELRGFYVFLDEQKGDCFHCHELGNFMTTFEFINNGLNLNSLVDAGLYNITGKGTDIGKFKTPSLLNLKYTAPYMHDGRFKTLREVIDFYDTGFQWHPITNLNLDPNLLKHFDKTTQKPIPRKWSEQDKQDLIAFLLSLSDESFIRDPAFK
ncbi:MAG: cytochrome-c peroxidase [Flavobacteriales bacterium]|nr:cytochrome-c peroxidase [Flavobacteriales bacterium]